MPAVIPDIATTISDLSWHTYARHHPHAWFSHMPGWTQTLASVYDLPWYCLGACTKNGRGRITGILPLVLFAPPGLDRRLISLPYTDGAGVLADDPKTAAALIRAGIDLAADLDAAHLELRQGCTMTADGRPVRISLEEMGLNNTGLTHRAHDFKVSLCRDLPGSEEALWQAIGPKVRNQVRKARKTGWQARTGGTELAAPFFKVFSENMRDLGSPVHDPALFSKMDIGTDGGQAIFLVERNRVAGAAAMAFCLGKTLANPWASSLRRFRPECPNMLLYWSMLAHGVKTGCHCFDFGRSSPNAPAFRFKSQWGARPLPLTWHVFSRPGAQWHPDQESLSNPSWQQTPLPESRQKGPALRRWISL